MLERKREREAGSVVEGDGVVAAVQTRLESEEGEACGNGGADAGNMQVKAVLLPVTALLSGPVGAVAVAATEDDARADGTSSIAFSGKSATPESKRGPN